MLGQSGGRGRANWGARALRSCTDAFCRLQSARPEAFGLGDGLSRSRGLGLLGASVDGGVGVVAILGTGAVSHAAFDTPSTR